MCHTDSQEPCACITHETRLHAYLKYTAEDLFLRVSGFSFNPLHKPISASVRPEDFPVMVKFLAKLDDDIHPAI